MIDDQIVTYCSVHAKKEVFSQVQCQLLVVKFPPKFSDSPLRYVINQLQFKWSCTVEPVYYGHLRTIHNCPDYQGSYVKVHISLGHGLLQWLLLCIGQLLLEDNCASHNYTHFFILRSSDNHEIYLTDSVRVILQYKTEHFSENSLIIMQQRKVNNFGSLWLITYYIIFHISYMLALTPPHKVINHKLPKLSTIYGLVLWVLLSSCYCMQKC